MPDARIASVSGALFVAIVLYVDLREDEPSSEDVSRMPECLVTI